MLISKFILSLATLCSSILASSASNSIDGESRIVGGSFVDVNTYPWFTTLLYMGDGQENRQGCGAMLVAPTWVLTAAHCIDSDIRQNGAVRIGAFEAPFQQGNNGGQYVEFRRLKNVINHPNYNSDTENNDFSLLQLMAPSTITPVPMDTEGVELPAGKLVKTTCQFSQIHAQTYRHIQTYTDIYRHIQTYTDIYRHVHILTHESLSYSYMIVPIGYPNLWAIGHGDTAEGGEGSQLLKHAQLNYVTNADCTGEYGYDEGDITGNMMCARDDGEDSCQGDSGGPLYDSANNLLVGVVSWGNGW